MVPEAGTEFMVKIPLDRVIGIKSESVLYVTFALTLGLKYLSQSDHSFV